MSAPPELAIQVVNYRTRSFLERCLTTATRDLAGGELTYEINLLDNSDEQLEDLTRSVPYCRAFLSPSNLGFGAGHNLLASKTTASHLLILNPDVEFVSRGAIEALLRALAGATAVGPKLVSADGEPQPYDHGRLRGLRAQIALRGGHSYWRETDQRQEVAWVSGAALLIKRAAFEAVGGFDEQLFLYKEDEDVCLRLRQAGGHVIYEPAVSLLHHGSVVADRREGLARSTSYYFAKHFPRRHVRGLFAAAHQGLAYLRL